MLRNLADVTPQEVRWLWPNRIPLGKFTTLSGDRGLGKSFLTLDIAARVSNAVPFPDQQEHCEVGNTIQREARQGSLVALPAAAPAEATPETAAQAPRTRPPPNRRPRPGQGAQGQEGQDAEAPKERKVGGLSACAQVLAEIKEPMSAKAMVEKAIEKGRGRAAAKRQTRPFTLQSSGR